MKIHLIATVALCTAVAYAPAYAHTHLPSICASQPTPPPEHFWCPSPYVELIPEHGDDEIFSRAWHCQETGYSLGETFNGGCGGWKGMFTGWRLPASPAETTAPAKPRETAPATRRGTLTYLSATFVLFDDFLQMQRDGVFLGQGDIALLKEIGIRIPNDFRGHHAPGGFLARPPGSDWKKRFEDLRDNPAYADSEQCVWIPKDHSSDELVCGIEIWLLADAAIFGKPQDLERIINRFWLAKICHETPAACPLVAEY